METSDDLYLTAQAAAGDDAAFNVLFHRHAPSLAKWCAAKLKDPALIEDIIQETFFALWRQAPTLREGSIKAWLFTVARNKLIDALRKQQPLVTDDQLQQVGCSEEPWQHPFLEQELAKLPSSQRDVFLLTFICGLSYREISQIMDIPVGTVKSRMYHCRRVLQQAWKRGDHYAGL